MTPRRLLFLLLAALLALAAPVRGVRAEDEPAQDGDAKPAKKKAKKKTYDYDRSKYKSREPSQTPTYRFNEKGEAINEETRKKSSTKKKKRSEPPEVGGKEGSGACGSEESCTEKKSEADAL